MKKKIFIFLNKTSLAHTQTLNYKFLKLLTKNNHVTIISSYNLNKSQLLKQLDLKIIKIKDCKPKNFIKRSIYSFLKSVKLHTTINFNKNITLKDFKLILLKLQWKRNKLKSIVYIPLWLLVHNLLKISIFAKIYRKFEIIYFSNKDLEILLLKNKPDLVVTTSPGWWEDDNFFLYSSNKLKIKSVCIVLSWDQPTGMGFMPALCSKYLVWSKKVKEDLIKFHGILKKNIHVVGALHWDHYFFKQRIKRKKHKQVLICLKSPTRTRHLKILDMLKQIINQNYHFKIHFLVRPHPIYFSKRYYSLLEDFKKMSSEENNIISVQNLWGRYNFKTKDFIEKSVNLNFLIDREITFRNISKKNILSSNLIINFFSTYSVEASILKVPIINYIHDEKMKSLSDLNDKKNLYMDYRQNHVQRIIQNIETAKSLNQLVKMINIYLLNSKRNNIKMQKFFKNETNLKGESIKNIYKYLTNF
tara:strand:- start:2566 stop:3984 length:1419 start_codon:yes stop_codon:yes gene_type:complete